MTSGPVGILMLNTSFERLLGDAGNPRTWPFPAKIAIVQEATVEAVIDKGADGIAPYFVAAARRLVEDDGAIAITTTCGFLAVHQRTLAAAVPVPVATSSLLQVPMVDALLPPGKRSGIVTFDAKGLSARILAAAGAPADTPVVGLPPGGHFQSRIRLNQAVTPAELEREVDGVIEGFLDRHPEVGALVFECANLPTFSAGIARRFGRPVFDLVTMIGWLRAGVLPATYKVTA